MNIPTAHSSESLERFIQHILKTPAPESITRQYLKNNGFVSGNDPELRHIFRLLGFLNKDYAPTQKWNRLKEHRLEVLSDAVENCYAELFTLYPDAAFGRSDEELKIWFRPPITGTSKTSVDRAIRTFKKLCVLAGIVPDNRVTATDGSLPEQKGSSAVGVFDKKQLVLQIPPLGSRLEYEELLETIKKVFYS